MSGGFESVYGGAKQNMFENFQRISESESLKSSYIACSNDVADLELLLGAKFVARPISEMKSIILLEMQNAIFMNMLGSYKHAFSSLRSALEYFYSSILFSTEEVKYRHWRGGEDDLSWAAVMEPERGVFSPRFFTAFAPELGHKANEFSELARKLYRECSEYVHSNPKKVTNSTLTYEYDEALSLSFLEKISVAKTLFVFQFVVLYFEHLPVPELEETILDEFGQMDEVRQKYE